MIRRRSLQQIRSALRRQAVVALIGPRQTGKTTLALDLAAETNSLYLDLETRADRSKLADPALFLEDFENSLVMLDEIHRLPEIFQELRGLVDRGRRKGIRNNRFLVLGSASIDLLRQSGESLAGRIEYVELHPLDVLEAASDQPEQTKLWVRGGFPDSFLANSDSDSFVYRQNFIRTYLERDIPQFGVRIPAETLERLWTMLAHSQGSPLNASRLASSLGITAPTVGSYIDLLSDLLLVRRLPPHFANVRKRLVKSPKVYVRDSGLVHALLGLADLNELSGHPVVGPSWEGFVIENLLAAAPPRTRASFYRTATGAEVDLLLALPGNHGLWAIEIKRGLAPSLTKGFHHARADLEPDRCFLVNSSDSHHPVSADVEAIGLLQLAALLSNLGK